MSTAQRQTATCKTCGKEIGLGTYGWGHVKVRHGSHRAVPA